jgi:hypothetical protein
MKLSDPLARTMRTTWRISVRDIAAALEIPLSPQQWIILEDAEGEGVVLGSFVDVVVWERV